jgi:glycosyltransferase involved in cell wall biosynthesis
MQRISVCTPCFNECENIRRCYETIKRIFETELPGYEREHVFSDNCSTDGTIEILREIAASDRSVKVILNARNFGIVRSSANCVFSTSGAAVFMFVPADLQDPPELMPQFLRLWEQGYEVVYGVRESRSEFPLMALARRAYYFFLKRLSTVELPMNVSDFQLLDRRVVQAMHQFNDFYPFLRALPFQCTSQTVGVPYRWAARVAGVSKNRFMQLLDQGLNGVISTTQVPTRLALFFGLIIAACSLIYAIINVVVAFLSTREDVGAGIRTLIAGMFFFNGLILLVVGILGEYILAIHQQVRQRPGIIERERINFDSSDQKKS